MYFVGTSNDLHLAVGVKVYLVFFSRREFEVVFCMNRKKISFSRQDFADCEIVIWGLIEQRIEMSILFILNIFTQIDIQTFFSELFIIYVRLS